MELSEKEAFELQQCMCELMGDDHSPSSIGYYACGRGFSVNIIYRCLVSGLWDIWSGVKIGSNGFNINDCYSFCKGLAEHEPEDSFRPELTERERWKVCEFWEIPQIMATPLCDPLLDKYSPQAGDYEYLYDNLCVPLIEEVETLFERHGVPWRAGDLFGIREKERLTLRKQHLVSPRSTRQLISPVRHLNNPELIKIDSGFYKLREREMPASSNPNAAAQDYIRYLFGGEMPSDREPIPIKSHPDCWLARSADGSTVVYRPVNTTNNKATNNIATVEIYNPDIRLINGARSVKLRFPYDKSTRSNNKKASLSSKAIAFLKRRFFLSVL